MVMVNASAADVRLIEQIVGRDPSALAELYDRHCRLLFTLILTVPVYRFIFVMTLLVIGLVHVSIGGIQYMRGEKFTLFDFLQRARFAFVLFFMGSGRGH